MLTHIDHLVVVVERLDQAVRNYEQLGFTVVPGGRHPVGTHNALIAFTDGAYLELIAFYEPSPDHRWWAPLQRGGGLVDFCLRTGDLRADTAIFRRAGVDFDDPKPLSRVRPDGYELHWVLSIPRGAARGVAPFLIQDETPREERVPGQTAHRNGVTGIGAVTVAVENLERVHRWYSSALRQAGEEVRRDDLDATGVRFAVGPHVFDFVVPSGSGSPLGGWLETHSGSPYAATLTTVSGAGGWLDQTRTLGARLALV